MSIITPQAITRAFAPYLAAFVLAAPVYDLVVAIVERCR